MKKVIYTLLIIGLGLMAQTVSAQVPGRICNWDNDKKGAVVLTFDDWTPGQFPIATPELKSRNLNATFFIITNNVASWNWNWNDVFTEISNGNEIGNHTYSHPYLAILNDWASQPSNVPDYPNLTAQITQEIGGARRILQGEITNQSILSFAYPFGNFNAQVQDSVLANGHISARGVNPPTNFTYNFAVNPMDYYNLATYTMSSAVSLDAYFGQIQNVINGGGLLTFLYHSLENPTEVDTWYNPVQQSALEQQLDTLASVRNQVWITTMMQAIKYHKEKRCASLTSISVTDTLMVVNLTDTLSNNSIYSQPLSLKIFTNGVKYTAVTQNGVKYIVDAMYGDTVMFHAIPDAGQIQLTYDAYYENTLGIKTTTLISSDITMGPVPTNGLLNITSSKELSNPTFTVFDAAGKKVYDTTVNDTINYYQIDMSGYAKGMYYIYIFQQAGTIVKKAIVMD